jgi:uncharacterized protein (TIGR04255 family)
VSSKFPHLNQAPIREAVLDLFVEARPDLRTPELREYCNDVRDEFPDVVPIRHLEAQFALTEDGATSSSATGERGFLCWTTDRLRATQARRDGWTVNHVGSYESWDSLRAQARALFPRYVQHARPRAVSRAALRYINEFDVSFERLADQLLIGAKLPPLAPAPWRTSTARVELAFAEGVLGSVTQHVTAPAAPTVPTKVILDIEVASATRLEPESDELWRALDNLRNAKNELFFSALASELMDQFR